MGQYKQYEAKKEEMLTTLLIPKERKAACFGAIVGYYVFGGVCAGHLISLLSGLYT
jgi:hypothetical protein